MCTAPFTDINLSLRLTKMDSSSMNVRKYRQVINAPYKAVRRAMNSSFLVDEITTWAALLEKACHCNLILHFSIEYVVHEPFCTGL